MHLYIDGKLIDLSKNDSTIALVFQDDKELDYYIKLFEGIPRKEGPRMFGWMSDTHTKESFQAEAEKVIETFKQQQDEQSTNSTT